MQEINEQPRPRSGTRCSVAICSNDYYTSKRKGKTLSFFSFPKDQTLLKEWLTSCYRKDKVNPISGRICSDHFTEDDFERDLQAELMNVKRRKFLKKHAVPSVNLKSNSKTLQDVSHRTIRIKKKKPIQSSS